MTFFSFPSLKLGIYIKPYIDSDVYGMLVVKWWNQKLRILGTWQLRFIIWLFFRNQSEKVNLLIKTLI